MSITVVGACGPNSLEAHSSVRVRYRSSIQGITLDVVLVFPGLVLSPIFIYTCLGDCSASQWLSFPVVKGE